MAHKKSTLRQMPPLNRKFSRILGEVESAIRRAKNMEPDIVRLELDSKALAFAKQPTHESVPLHCPDCVADGKVFCPRNPDAKCLECGGYYCGAHIGPHLEKVHCVTLTLDHCRET